MRPHRLPFPWLTRASLLASLALAVSACVDFPPKSQKRLAEAEDVTPLSPLPVSAAWVNAPGMTGVFQRGLVNGSEQRIAIVNHTALEGDNQLILRTRRTFGDIGRLQFDEMMRRIGGAPMPFADLTSGELTAGSDAAGDYLWAERSLGADTRCVFAMRRLDATSRQLPREADALDIVLRNCVTGGLEQALLPITSGSVLTGAANQSAGGVPGRMLSPLAAPTAR